MVDSYDKAAIGAFLSDAQDRIRNRPGRQPFAAERGHLVICWLRGLLDLPPSEMRQSGETSCTPSMSVSATTKS
jgi:hypothetical protein